MTTCLTTAAEDILSPAARLNANPMSSRQWIVVLIVALVNAVDGFDILAISFAAPGISTEWQVPTGQLGILLSLELMGMAFGSLALGGIADRIGRRKTMLIALLIMVFAVGFCALARSLVELGALRLLTGIAIGAMVPSLTAMIAETANERRRDMAITWLGVGYSLGAIVGGLLVSVLLRSFDWRAIFVLGAVAAGIILILVLIAVPESVGYLQARRPPQALERINRTLQWYRQPLADGLPDPDSARTTPASVRLTRRQWTSTVVPLALAYSLHLGTFYFVLKWFPKIASLAGTAPAAAAAALSWVNIGGALGSFLFGFLVARIDLKRALIVNLIACAVLVAAFGGSGTDLTLLTLTATTATFFANGGVVGLFAFIARNFAAEVRATGISVVFGAGRGLSVLAPILAGYLFEAGIPLAGVAAIIGSSPLIAAFIIGRSRLTSEAGG